MEFSSMGTRSLLGASASPDPEELSPVPGKASWQMGSIHSWRCCAASRWLRSVVVSRKALVSRGQLSPSAGSTDTQSARRMTRLSPAGWAPRPVTCWPQATIPKLPALQPCHA